MIRPFNPNDSERCKRIIEECFNKSVKLGEKERAYIKKVYTQEGYFQNKTASYPIFVFEEDGLVIALGGVEKNEIKKLYIDPNYHQKGVGSRMLSHLEAYGIKQGYEDFVLYCFENSVDFYKNRGYNVIGPHFFEGEGIRVPAIKMVKEKGHSK